jgi:hypothetical protein
VMGQVEPGAYRVTLTVGGREQSQSAVILPDPTVR